MKNSSKGLKISLYLWPTSSTYEMDAQDAGLYIKGDVTNNETQEKLKFNRPVELLEILSRWNVEHYKNWKNV